MDYISNILGRVGYIYIIYIHIHMCIYIYVIMISVITISRIMIVIMIDDNHDIHRNLANLNPDTYEYHEFIGIHETKRRSNSCFEQLEQHDQS